MRAELLRRAKATLVLTWFTLLSCNKLMLPPVKAPFHGWEERFIGQMKLPHGYLSCVERKTHWQLPWLSLGDRENNWKVGKCLTVIKKEDSYGSFELEHPGSLQRLGKKVFEPECSWPFDMSYRYLLTRDVMSSLPHRWGNKEGALPGKETLFHRLLKNAEYKLLSILPELSSDYHAGICQWHCHFVGVGSWDLMIGRSDGEAVIRHDIAFHTSV